MTLSGSLSLGQLSRTTFAQAGVCRGVTALALASIIISIQHEVRARS